MHDCTLSHRPQCDYNSTFGLMTHRYLCTTVLCRTLILEHDQKLAFLTGLVL